MEELEFLRKVAAKAVEASYQKDERRENYVEFMVCYGTKFARQVIRGPLHTGTYSVLTLRSSVTSMP